MRGRTGDTKVEDRSISNNARCHDMLDRIACLATPRRPASNFYWLLQHYSPTGSIHCSHLDRVHTVIDQLIDRVALLSVTMDKYARFEAWLRENGALFEQVSAQSACACDWLLLFFVGWPNGHHAWFPLDEKVISCCSQQQCFPVAVIPWYSLARANSVIYFLKLAWMDAVVDTFVLLTTHSSSGDLNIFFKTVGTSRVWHY